MIFTVLGDHKGRPYDSPPVGATFMVAQYDANCKANQSHFEPCRISARPLLDYEDYLSVREELAKQRVQRQAQRQRQEEALATMLASERILAREWDTPEEDAAWQDL